MVESENQSGRLQHVIQTATYNLVVNCIES